MYPQYVEVQGVKYKINTDFRIALKCNQIAEDQNIGDYERALAIVYKLFGEKGLRSQQHIPYLIKAAINYLKCGEETKKQSDEKKDLDYIQDQKYISSSFKFDYGYDPYKKKYVHWYEFWNDLNNLSYSEFGSCCILSRIRQIRNADLSKIKDPKERERMKKAQQAVALKTESKKPTELQYDSSKKFFEQFYKK